MSTPGPILRLNDVRKEFGGVHAVRGVDLEVAYGERRALLGPNGAGKTTLFNAIAGDFAVTSGTIELFERDVTDLPKRARTRLGMTRTYQISRLFAGLTVLDNLYLASLGVDPATSASCGARSATRRSMITPARSRSASA